MDIRAAIEIFHISFCRVFLSDQDKTLIALKGGCNLRFFHGSNRYSEDIDFDVSIIARETLKKRMDKVLESTSLQSVLAARKLKVSSFSAPKQTDTVQRWKVALHCGGIDIPTKIEFSRRGVEQRGIEFSSISPIILSKYHITPTYLGHYSASLAIDQKIEALAGRPETQARDLYDLDLLLNRHPTAEVSTKPNTLLKAIECAMSIDQDQFRGQVVEFLEDDAKVYYASKSSFDTMQNRVITLLEGLQNASV